MIVLELEFAAMKPRHRGGEAQPQARAGLGAALLEPHETFDHAAAIGRRDARTVIRHGQRDALAATAGADHDFRRGAVELVAVAVEAFGPGIFDGVVDQIGERLAHQFGIAAHAAPPRAHRS